MRSAYPFDPALRTKLGASITLMDPGGKTMGWLLSLLAAVTAAGAAQTSPAPYPASRSHTAPAWFVDVGPEAGLSMRNVNGGVTTKKYIIETTGSGVAVLDYDQDGWPDLFFANGAPEGTGRTSPPGAPTGHLYHNNHDGTFSDRTRKAGLEVAGGWGQGVCVGDYDNDGYPDLYVTYYGKNRLFHNERNGMFRETAEFAGVAGSGRAWGTGCAFVDYDRDGKLDLLVANYVDFDIAKVPKLGEGMMCVWKGAPVMCGPRGLASTPNVLYHNLGNGRFEDVSKNSGIEKTDGHFCFSVSSLDYNGDGWPDLYVACDSTPSILYRNNKDGTFSDVAADAAVAFDEDGREQAGMGFTVGDYDGDGLEDIFKTNFSDDTSSLYRNNGDGTFSSRIFESGLGLNTQYLGWGTMFLDVDNDGRPDLLSANGHVYPEVDTRHLGSTFKEPRLLYWNAGGGKFQDISNQSGPGISVLASSRGLAIADFWNDGRISAAINNMNGAPMLLVNMAPQTNHWLGVSVAGTKSNHDGIGARVTVTAGQKTNVLEVRSGGSYISSSDLRLHFGLGSATKVDRLHVMWPSGLEESFPVSGVDRMLKITEGSGVATRP